MRLSGVLVFCTSLTTLCPSGLVAEEISGTINDRGNVAIGAIVEIPREFDKYPRLKNQVNTAEHKPCDVFGYQATCFQGSKSLNPEFPTGYYGLAMLFDAPVPALIYLVGTKTRSAAFYKESPQKTRTAPLQLPRTVTADGRKSLSWIYDRVFTEAMNWTYERASALKDADGALHLLEDLLKSTGGIDNCAGVECAAVYRFSSFNGDEGHAYCAYLGIDNWRSAPYDCVALHIKRKDGDYFASFNSPFIGEQYAPANEPISCSVAYRGATIPDSEETISKVKDAVAGTRAPFDLKQVKLKSGLTYLVGRPRASPSPFMPKMDEYTGGVFEITNYGELNLRGYLVPMLSNAGTREPAAFLPPSKPDITAYYNKFVAMLSERLSETFQRTALCQYRPSLHE